MSTETRLEDLLLDWQEARAAGRDVPAAELCRGCPELLPEVERRLESLRQVGALLGPAADTVDHSAGHARTGSPLPEALGGYRVLRLLGEGGMGQVLEAEDTRLGRRVALKVMRPALSGDARARQRFLREARAAAALQHDHVVPIYQVGEDGGTFFIAMPLLEGEPLEARLKREGALPVAEALRVAREAAEGLAAAHEKGLVHRDCTPGNLWLEAPAGRVKVLDFGLAKHAEGDDVSRPGAVVGTPAYMSPEQVDGRPLDGRTDLFSLGCVLYRCLTGRPPFEGPSLTAVLRAVAERDPPPPHEVRRGAPPDVSQLVMRLLSKRPEGRPASARDLVLQLRSLEAALPTNSQLDTTLAAPPGRAGRAGWGPGTTALALAGGTALAVAAALLLALLPGLRGPADTPAPGPGGPQGGPPPPPPACRGEVRVLLERETEPGVRRMLQLDDPRALPMRVGDRFRIEATVTPPAYLYLVWVDPGKDVTPVYPWDPTKGWGSRPAREAPTGKVSLPPGAADRYTAPGARPGVATMVVLASAAPLEAPDDAVRGWFESLPDLPLPPGGERGVVWFDNYAEVAGDRARLRTFKVVGSEAPFAAWQGRLQKAVGGRAAFQTAVSFARAGGS